MNKLMNTFAWLMVLLFIGVSCREDTIQPEVFGNLEGEVVLEADETVKIEDAKITTAPASNTLFTDPLGRFSYESIKEGSYTLRVEKTGYVLANENVAIYENETTTITIKLRPDTSDNQAPTIPQWISPADGSQDLPVELSLAWTATDDDPEDVLRYDLQLFDNNMSLIQSPLIYSTDTTYQLSNLTYGTTYYWQVIVSDGEGIVNGPIWQFQTEPFPEHRFLFARQQNGKYDIYSSDEGGNAIQLTDIPGSSNWRPLMNPQRDKIAFISNVGIESHIYIMNRDGSNLSKVTEVPITGYSPLELDFCWSPDGSRLLYMQNSRLFTIQADGSGFSFFADTPTGFTFAECDWTGQGNQILARTVGTDIYESSIYTLNEAGNYQLEVFHDVAGATGGAVFSIDGSKMLYTHDISSFENAEGRQLDAHIFIKDLTTFVATDISVHKEDGTNDLDPRFSPDGAWIIFTNTNNDGISQRNIYKMRLDGTERTLLFENAEMPDWK